MKKELKLIILICFLFSLPAHSTNIPPDMIYIQAGVFFMGSDKLANEKPCHKIFLPAFYIDKYEVTNAFFEKFVKATNYKPQGDFKKYFVKGKENHPVVNVSWKDACAYCAWLKKRLPTEAEWEKAARGNDKREFTWGNEKAAKRFNGWEYGHHTTVIVGKYTLDKSPYGVYDMAGNVREWTSSIYKQYPFNASDGRENMNINSRRVIRGASWFNTLDVARCSNRHHLPQMHFMNNIGFRCARP